MLSKYFRIAIVALPCVSTAVLVAGPTEAPAGFDN